MQEESAQDILVMAILMVTVDDVLGCALQEGLAEDDITTDLLLRVKEKVTVRLAEWRGTAREMVHDIVRSEIGKCPLGMTCTPDCRYRDIGQCTLPIGKSNPTPEEQ